MIAYEVANGNRILPQHGFREGKPTDLDVAMRVKVHKVRHSGQAKREPESSAMARSAMHWIPARESGD